MTDQLLDPCKNITQANLLPECSSRDPTSTDVWVFFIVIFSAMLLIPILEGVCSSCRRSQNEAAIRRSYFEDPPTRGAIHNVVPEVRLEINDELDVVDEKLHNFVLPENVKEQIYERGKCKNENGHDCVICLEEFKEKETIRVVEPCNHSYHTYCIKKWLINNNRSCPICRNHIPDRSRYH